MAGDPTDNLVNDDTREAEVEEATAKPDPGRGPTPDEEEAAERGAEQAPDVSEPYKDQVERGANAKGEGQIP
jgi:hypothetical protein